MRNVSRVFVVLGLLVLPAVDWAKGPPPPITCPADVAMALAETCPCEGKVLPDASVQPWRNHGQYVSCTVHFRNALRKAGCLADDARRTLARCTARSTCGKVGRVLCCVSESGTCSDPTPGDLTAAGTCSNDASLVCDVDADCTKSRAQVARDEATCVEEGGASTGQGSVCDPCEAPAP